MIVFDVTWVESSAIPTDRGEHFCRWRVVADVEGVRATVTAECDYTDGGPYAAALRKRHGRNAQAELDKVRAKLAAHTEAKAKRRALRTLGIAPDDAVRIVGVGNG